MPYKVGQKFQLDPNTKSYFNGRVYPCPRAGKIGHILSYEGYFMGPHSKVKAHWYKTSLGRSHVNGIRIWPIDDEASDESFEEMMNKYREKEKESGL